MEACQLRNLGCLHTHATLPVLAWYGTDAWREHFEEFRLRHYDSIHCDLPHLHCNRLQYGGEGVKWDIAYDHQRHTSVPNDRTVALGLAFDATESGFADKVLQEAQRNIFTLQGTVSLTIGKHTKCKYTTIVLCTNTQTSLIQNTFKLHKIYSKITLLLFYQILKASI